MCFDSQYLCIRNITPFLISPNKMSYIAQVYLGLLIAKNPDGQMNVVDAKVQGGPSPQLLLQHPNRSIVMQATNFPTSFKLSKFTQLLNGSI